MEKSNKLEKICSEGIFPYLLEIEAEKAAEKDR